MTPDQNLAEPLFGAWLENLLEGTSEGPFFRWMAGDESVSRDEASFRGLELCSYLFEHAATVFDGIEDSRVADALCRLLLDERFESDLEGIYNVDLPWMQRVRCVIHIESLFQDVFDARLTKAAISGDEGSGLAGVCKHWWLWWFAAPRFFEVDPAIDAVLLAVCIRILGLGCDACQESSLLALAWFELEYSGAVKEVVSRYLNNGERSARLRELAADAAEGNAV